MPGDRATLTTVGESMSRLLASRYSRRSFLGTVGRGTVTLSLLAGSAALLDSSSAEAHSVPCPCPGGCGLSVTCYQYWGDGNTCPPGTCGCGWWTTCASPCSAAKVWSDCCSDGTACTGGAQCINGAPSCWNHKTYSCGCATTSAHIVCRRWYCRGDLACTYGAC